MKSVSTLPVLIVREQRLNRYGLRCTQFVYLHEYRNDEVQQCLKFVFFNFQRRADIPQKCFQFLHTQVHFDVIFRIR